MTGYRGPFRKGRPFSLYGTRGVSFGTQRRFSVTALRDKQPTYPPNPDNPALHKPVSSAPIAVANSVRNLLRTKQKFLLLCIFHDRPVTLL